MMPPTDWFGENGHIALIGKSMQSLAPPAERLYAQAWDGRRLVAHKVGFFL